MSLVHSVHSVHDCSLNSTNSKEICPDHGKLGMIDTRHSARQNNHIAERGHGHEKRRTMNTKTIKEIPCIVIFTENREQGEQQLKQMSEHRPDWSILGAFTTEELKFTLEQSTVDCLLIPVMNKEEAAAHYENYAALDEELAPPALMAVPQTEQLTIRQALAAHEASSFYILQNDLDNVTTAVKSLVRVCHVERELRRVNTLLAELIEERSKTLHESSERIRFLSEFSGDAIFEVEKDRSTGVSTFISANQTACTWLDYSEEEILSLPFAQFLDTAAIEKVTKLLVQATEPQEFRFDLTVKTRSGEDIYLDVGVRAFEIEKGLRMFAVGRKTLPHDFRKGHTELEDVYESLVSQTGQLMYDGNLNTQRMIWSGAAEQITGFSIALLSQEGMRGWRQRILFDDYPKVIDTINHAIGHLSSYDVEYGFLHESGEIRYLEDHGVVLPDHTGSGHRIMGTIKDITEKRMREEARQRMERELQHTQRLESLGVLAGGIAHDFNNILAGIIGLTDLALREIPSDSFAFEDLNEALRAAHRAKELVHQILAFSRQGGRERNPIYPHIITREVIRLLRASLPPSIRIREHIDLQSGAVLANAAQLHQVITNFSTNAAQAIKGEGGTLTFQVNNVEIDEAFSEQNPKLEPGSYVKISVSDTGHGMAPSILARVFDPFFTTKGPGEGTGMGLSVAHGIVTDHGGTILASSELQQGSTFDCYIPRILDMEGLEKTKLSEGPEKGITHVLFVDDDAAVRRFASSALPRLGFEIILCESAEEALKVIETEDQHLDLVITDQIMPGMSGTDLATIIQMDRPELPVILFTGFSRDFSPDTLKKLGIHSVLRKPIIVRELLMAIRQALAAKEKKKTDNPQIKGNDT